jgi:transposase
MAAAYSLDLRVRVLKDADTGLSSKELAERYHVSCAWVDALKQRRRETGSFAPRLQTKRRRRVLAPAEARFPNGKALASDVGLIPSEYSSGARQRLGHLSKQGNPFLRFLWGEAVMGAVRRDPELQRFFRRKLPQKGFGKARGRGAEARDSPVDHVAGSDHVRRILSPEPTATVMNGAARAGRPGMEHGPGGE